jgi:hypothetical protein
MTDEPTRDEQLDAFVTQLEETGFLEQLTNAKGEPAMHLTPNSERVARQLAMADDDGQDALMAALLAE